MWLLDELAEARIAEAAAAGQLDDLPGAGEPLALDQDALVPPELRTAYRLLKNAGFVPPKIALRREITEIEQLLALAQTSAERTAISRRLNALLLRLGLARGHTAPLYVEQAYLEKLQRRIDNAT